MERLFKQVFVVGVAIGIGVGFLPVPVLRNQVPDEVARPVAQARLLGV
jgi:hypothetical protein